MHTQDQPIGDLTQYGTCRQQGYTAESSRELLLPLKELHLDERYSESECHTTLLFISDALFTPYI